jgi:hypothetical protein
VTTLLASTNFRDITISPINPGKHKQLSALIAEADVQCHHNTKLRHPYLTQVDRFTHCNEGITLIQLNAGGNFSWHPDKLRQTIGTISWN